MNLIVLHIYVECNIKFVNVKVNDAQTVDGLEISLLPGRWDPGEGDHTFSPKLLMTNHLDK